MAKILQYKCTKLDSKPFLFLDHPVSEEWAAAQRANQELLVEVQKICDTVEISDTEIVMTKQCENDVAMSKFILAVSMLEVEHKFAMDQFEIYHPHNTTFSYSQQEV
jgi:hypothetical protein